MPSRAFQFLLESGATRLRALDLRGVPEGDDSIVSLLSACTGLQELTIDDRTYAESTLAMPTNLSLIFPPLGLRVRNSNWEAFARSLPHLTFFSSTANTKLTTGLTWIAIHMSNLRELDITACFRLTQENLVTFAENLATTQLTDLNLRGVPKVDDAFLAELAPKLPRLRKLNLELCNLVSSAGIDSISEFCPLLEIFQCNQITKIPSAETWVRAIRTWTRLTYLDLAECAEIDHTVFEAIGEYSKSLWYLNVRQSKCVTLAAA